MLKIVQGEGGATDLVPAVVADDDVAAALEGAADATRLVEKLSGAFYEKDLQLTALETGLFDGIKLHELEGYWVEKRPSALRRVLRIAQERELPVQFHSGPDEFCSPRVLARFAQEFPSVRFDFAHCRPMDEMAEVIASWNEVGAGGEGDFRFFRVTVEMP